MGKVIVFGNEKGGSGKITTAFHVAIVLVNSSAKILTIDLDLRQKSFTRYLENRKSTIERDKIDLKIPEIIDIEKLAIDLENRVEIKKIIEEKKLDYDFIIIDTPGHYNNLSKALHEQADIIITPINDSFVDVDLIGQVDRENLAASKAGIYSNMVFECKKQRALNDKKEINWYVIRNRISGTTTNNMQNIEEALKKLSSKYGFNIISGFGDRVIFKELFLDGLTLSDVRISSKVKMNLSLVAARSELREIVNTIKENL